MDERKYEFDNLKGILIFFVVLGHLIFSFSHNNSDLVQKTTSFIYFFHMPLFLIVSGYFSRKNISKENLLKLFFIFVTMNISFTIYDYLVYGAFNLFQFKYSSWYILLLALYRLIISNTRIKKIINEKTNMILLISLLVAIIAGFFNTELFVLRIFENWFYFVFGYSLIKNKKIHNLTIDKNFILLLLIFFLSIVFVISSEYSYNIYYYLGETYTRNKDAIVKLIICLTNAFVYVLSINILPKKEIPLLTKIGKNSLYIYILHRIITLVIGEYIIVDRKLILLLDIIMALLICLILASKPIVKLTSKIIDLFTNGYLRKNMILTIISTLILITLFLFELYSKNIINFEKKKLNNSNLISIGFVGDLILLEEQVKNSKEILGYDFDYMFKYTKKYFDNTDFTIGVFEGPSDDNQPYSVGNYNDNKEIRINHPSSFINSIKNSGIDLVTTSTNHVYDMGYSGAVSTIKNLKDRGLEFVGTSTDSRPQIKIIEESGQKIGLLAYTFYSNYPNDTENTELTKFICDPNSENFEQTKNDIIKDFKYLKEHNVDLIIVLPHYGNEFNFDFTNYQEEWNKVFIENGADIIFGDHSHVIGPIKYYDDKIAVSSPGNYVNSYNGQDSDISQYVKVYIDKKTKKIKKVTTIPMLAQKDDKGYYPISLYDLKKNDNDNSRVKQALAIFGKVVMNDENIELQEEFEISEKKSEEQPLELTQEDKESLIYEQITISKKICFIGDSITEGTKNNYKPWYKNLIKNFNKKIVNISKGSYTSDNVLEEFSDEIEDSGCDLTIINIGTNDIRYNMTNPKKYQQNIKKIISLTNKDSRVILLSPWETYNSDKIIGENILIKKDLYGQYNTKLIEIAETNDNIYYINPNRYIKSHIYKYGESEYLLDGVHPNDKGIKLYSFSVLRGERY